MNRAERPDPELPQSAGPGSPATADPATAPATATGHRVPVRVVGTPPPPEAAVQPPDAALRSLPITGLSRRRVAWMVGIVASVWIVAVFARQVGDASAAAARADLIRQQNAGLSAEVAALQHERDTVQEKSFIEFQARAYGLGDTKDQRFQLSPDAPSLSPDAPGSASALLGPEPVPQSPLDSWLALLFGPGR